MKSHKTNLYIFWLFTLHDKDFKYIKNYYNYILHIDTYKSQNESHIVITTFSNIYDYIILGLQLQECT